MEELLLSLIWVCLE